MSLMPPTPSDTAPLDEDILEIQPIDIPQWHIDRDAADPSVEALECVLRRGQRNQFLANAPPGTSASTGREHGPFAGPCSPPVRRQAR